MIRNASRLLALSVLVALVAAPTALAAGKAAKTHDVTASIVSVDAQGKTLTIKDQDGKEMKVPVLDKAAGKLSTLKVGEKVVLTCEDDADGNHTGITAIKPAKA